MFLLLSVLLSFCLTSSSSLKADEEYYILTRDNVALKTYFWYPDNKTFPGPWPFVYEKTPYDARLNVRSGERFTSQGFGYFSQDVRGKFGSNGTYSFFRTSGNDSMDTIQWINDYMVNTLGYANGQLAIHGISADCLGQYASIMGVTQSGEWPDGDWQKYYALFSQQLTGICALGDGLGHSTVYQGGAYRDGLINRWLALILEESTTKIIKENENFGPYWYTLDGLYENQWNLLNQPLINVAGWYDIFGQYQMETIAIVNKTSVSAGQQILVVDPGGHCVTGDIFWPEGEAGWNYVNNEIGPKVFKAAFEANAKNETVNIHDVLDWNVMFYMLGPGGVDKGGNFWVQAKSFPLIIQNRYFYFDDCFGELCSLSETLPNKEKSVEYRYDPNFPVHTWGGNNLMVQPCGPWNQEFVEIGREDVIHFDSNTFNSEWAFVGNVTVNLYVSSDAVDTDFMAKIIDVYPDGKAMLIQDSVMRMRWRNGAYAVQQAPDMVENEIYNVQVNIGYCSWLFNSGHKLRVSITSSNHPRFSINYNSGLWVEAGNKNEQNAHNKIHFGGDYPSSVLLQEVSLDWLNDHKFDFNKIDRSNWWSKEESRRERGKIFRNDHQLMNEYMKQWDKVDIMAQQYYSQL